MSTQPIPRLSVEQYLEIERAAEFRSEYLNGEIFAVAGDSMNHALMAAEVVTRLSEQLRGKRCAVAGSDLRLSCKAFNILTYADATVICPPHKFQDGKKDTLIDATVIVEVLSRSTQNYDLGEKFRYYRSLPSFVEYLALAQDTIRSEFHVRQPDGAWLFRELNGPDALVDLKSIGCQLTLGPLYERVDFEAA